MSQGKLQTMIMLSFFFFLVFFWGGEGGKRGVLWDCASSE